MLYAKYECSRPYGLSQVDFQRFPSLFLCKIGCARAKPKYDPREKILTILVRGHPMMLQTKYECFQPNGLSQEHF